MDDDREREEDDDREREEDDVETAVYMWGYLPGAVAQRSPLLSPEIVRKPKGLSWKEVSGGGCGFAMAISDSGKLITWGSTDDLGQSYIACGKHGETPEPFPLPPEISVVRAAAGWAHCVAVTGGDEVYTWGWKECVPSGELVGKLPSGTNNNNVVFEKSPLTKQDSLHSQGSQTSGQTCSGNETRVSGGETSKRRRASGKKAAKSSSLEDESRSAQPRLVTLNTGVRIATVAAGGRHTLALSDMGQVWGWGYGGEGQLGLGSRMRMVSSPQPVPCIDSEYITNSGNMVPGNYVKAIACGGRHSVVVTDAGAVLAFGWGLHGQCGQGSTEDELSPVCVSSLLGIRIEGVAAGLWHTVCTSSDGNVFAFGGNQFGQLGTGADQAEALPRLLHSPSLEYTNAKAVSCGARHSAIITEDSKVFCWGWNKYGQLGLGDNIDRNIPSEVTIEGYVPRSVACGWWHTLLLAEPHA